VPLAGGPTGPPLVTGANRLYPCAWSSGGSSGGSSDGRRLIYQERLPGSGWDLLSVAVGRDGRPTGPPTPLLATPANEENAVPSPDGAWLAFESDEVDGTAQVYVAPFARPGEKLRVTIEGGRDARWGADGALHYWNTMRFEVRRLVGRVEGGRWSVAADAPVVTPASEGTTGGVPRLRSAPEVSNSYELDPATGRILILALDGPDPAARPFRMTVAGGWARTLGARLAAAP
jgi:hypothetical protein